MSAAIYSTDEAMPQPSKILRSIPRAPLVRVFSISVPQVASDPPCHTSTLRGLFTGVRGRKILRTSPLRSSPKFARHRSANIGDAYLTVAGRASLEVSLWTQKSDSFYCIFRTIEGQLICAIR